MSTAFVKVFSSVIKTSACVLTSSCTVHLICTDKLFYSNQVIDLRDRLQVAFLKVNEYKQINQHQFLLKL